MDKKLELESPMEDLRYIKKSKSFNRNNILSNFMLFWKYNKRISLSLFINYHLIKRIILKNKDYQEPKDIIKKVIFLVGKTNTGLTDVKGTQPRDALRKKGILSESCIGKLPRDIDNSMIVFIKCFPPKEVMRALKKKCTLVYEIMDNANPFLLENERILCDGIIFPNKRMQKDFDPYLPKKTKSFVMYHHWDPRLGETKTKKQNKNFSLAYFGTAPSKNAIFSDELNIPVFTELSDNLKYKNDFNCIYSMRKEGSMKFLYKPSTKLAIASAVGSNIITSKEPSAVELIGADYPYFTDTDFSSVKNKICI